MALEQSPLSSGKNKDAPVLRHCLASRETRVNILLSEVATPAHLPHLNTRPIFFLKLIFTGKIKTQQFDVVLLCSQA